MRNKKPEKEKNRVYIECSDTDRRVKGVILHKSERDLEVEMPTGYILRLQKRSRRGQYTFRSGMIEFLSDGREVV